MLFNKQRSYIKKRSYWFKRIESWSTECLVIIFSRMKYNLVLKVFTFIYSSEAIAVTAEVRLS